MLFQVPQFEAQVGIQAIAPQHGLLAYPVVGACPGNVEAGIMFERLERDVLLITIAPRSPTHHLVYREDPAMLGVQGAR
ncbi:hypothetical protein D9M69_575630 [compost metagenome]